MPTGVHPQNLSHPDVKAPRQIFYARIQLLIFRVLPQHRHIAVSHSDRHFPLAVKASEHLTGIRNALRYPARQLLIVFSGATITGSAENRQFFSFQLLQILTNRSITASLVRPGSYKIKIRHNVRLRLTEVYNLFTAKRIPYCFCHLPGIPCQTFVYDCNFFPTHLCSPSPALSSYCL